LRAIGGTAVVNLLARSIWITAAPGLGPLRSPSQVNLLATKSGFTAVLVASSLGCETGRRTVAWIRITGAAAQPIATKFCSFRGNRRAHLHGIRRRVDDRLAA
jgi:hypothetical protein